MRVLASRFDEWKASVMSLNSFIQWESHVGAGLLAKAVRQIHQRCLTRRLREQARSHT
ncbi:hypothetical protein EMIT0P12_30042 [Pseudomonas sp. IT-P12]